MTDLVQRLREDCHHPRLADEAADEIERLRAALLAVKEDDVYLDDWCPVCHEHPGADDQYHGGTDCVMKTITKDL